MKKNIFFFLLFVSCFGLFGDIRKSQHLNFDKIKNQNVTRDDVLRVTNVSYYPNPFSPDNDGQKEETTISLYCTVSGDLEILLINNETNWSYVQNVAVDAGWNQYIWDGTNAAGQLGDEGTYNVTITLNDGNDTDVYNQTTGIILDISAPEIQLISSAPNPFSPNADGYNDIHRVRFETNDVRTTFVGLIDVNLHPDSLMADFVADPNNGNMVGPDNATLSQYTEGSYLFIRRRSSTIDADAKYKLTINGMEEDITKGVSLYKLGYYSSPIYNVSEFIGMEYDESEEEDENQIYFGHDVLELYAVEGNATLNIYNNDGSIYSLNSLYDIYFGDDLTPWQNIFYQMTVNIGNSGESDPNIYLNEEIPDGRYIYRVIVTDDVGHEVEEAGEFIVDNNPIIVAGEIEPAKISPQNQDGILDISVIHYSVTEDAYVTIKIVDSQDNIIRILKDSEFTDTGANFVLWDGKNAAGDFVSEDVEANYHVEITAQDRWILDDVVSIRPTITIDNAIPSAADLFQPEPDSLITADITISGISDEIQSDIILFQNGINKGIVGQTPEYPGYFTFDATLEERNNNISIRLKDATGNLGASSDVVNVLLDSKAPVIIPTNPEFGETFTTSPIHLRTHVTDSGVGVEYVRFGLSVDGNESLEYIEATNSGNNIFEADYAVDPAITSLDVDLFVEAADKLGNLQITEEPVHFSYAEPTSTLPPAISMQYPQENQNLASLSDDAISFLITSYNGISTDQNDTNIQLIHPSGSIIEHESGAQLSLINVSENVYQLSLLLTAPLNAQGMDDGLYTISYRIENSFEQELVGSYQFRYDTIQPEISEFIINDTAQFVTYENTNLFSDEILTIAVTPFDDNAGIDWAPNVSNLLIYDEDNSLIPSVRSVVNNALVLTLNNPILADGTMDGAYTISGYITDNANNVKSINTSFSMQSNSDIELATSYPINGASLNTIENNVVSFTVQDFSALGINQENINFMLFGGGIVYSSANNNATVSVDILNDNQYKIRLNLLETPLMDGTSDGMYQVIGFVQNNFGASLNYNAVFTYDTIYPSIESVKVNDSTHQSEINNNDIVQHQVSEVSVAFNDVLSGVNFNNPSTSILLYRYQGSIVQGQKTFFGNEVKWTLNEPLSDDGSDDGVYEIRISGEDNAGNLIEETYLFTLDNPSPSSFVEMTPSNNTFINSLESQIVDVILQDARGINTQNIEDNYLTLTLPDGTIISNGNQAQFVLTALGNFQYRYRLLMENEVTQQGEYRVQIYGENLVGDVFQEMKTFTFDNEAPELASAFVLSGDSQFVWENNAEIYEQIEGMKFLFADYGIGIDETKTELEIFQDGSPILFNVEESNGDSLVVSLNTPIDSFGIDTEIIANLTIEDLLGQSTMISNTLHKNQVTFYVTDVYPVADNGAYTSSFNAVSIELQTDSSETLDVDTALFQFINQATGEMISDGNGAALNITQNGTIYLFTLNLQHTFATTGEDDGSYQLSLTVDTESGTQISRISSFDFDTQNPQIVFANVDQQAIHNDAFYVGQEITEITVQLNDLTSGVSFAQNNSNIYLFDEDMQEVEGTTTYDVINNTISISFANAPIQLTTTAVDYTLRIKAGDSAGNQYIEDRTFHAISDDTSQLVSVYPADNEVLTTIHDDEISIVIRDYVGINSNTLYTFLQVSDGQNIWAHNQNADQVISNSGNDYEITLDLDVALDEANYTVEYRVQNLNGRVLQNTSSFVLDKASPIVSNDRLILTTGNEIELVEGRKITDPISSFIADVSDFVGIDVATMTCQITDENNQILSNAPTYVNNQISCNLISPISQSGNYTVSIFVEDTLGQGTTYEKTFSLIDFQYEIVSISPANQSTINNEVTEIVVELLDENEIGLNSSMTNIVLSQVEMPTNIIQHNLGALQTISQVDNLYTITLTLNEPFALDGADDGQYKIDLNIVSTDNAQENVDFYFHYDTTKPVIKTVTINQTSIENGDIFQETMSSITALFEDETEMSFAPNLTKIKLFKDGVLRPGIRTYQGNNLVSLALTNPVEPYAESGTWDIVLQAFDKAGNRTDETYSIVLQPEINAQFVSSSPVANQVTNNAQTISVTVEDLNQIALTEDDFRIVLNGNGESYFDGQGAVSSFSNLGNHLYQYQITLENEPSTDGLFIARIYKQNELFNQWGFDYDTVQPEVQSISFWHNGTESGFQDGDSFASNVDFLELDFIDNNLNLADSNTTVSLQLLNSNLITGSVSIEGNTLRWTPAEALTTEENEGVYELSYIVYDEAGNELSESVQFGIRQEGFPSYINSSPENQSTVKSLSYVEVNVFDESGLDTTVSPSNYVRVFGPDGDSYAHENGATLTITETESNNYQYRLILENPLPTDGTKDGLYSMQIGVTNSDGNEMFQTIYFTLDTQAPSFASVQIGNDQNMLALENDLLVYQNIDKIRVTANDVLSGIDWTTASIELYDAGNVIVPGFISFIESQGIMTYTLDNALSNDNQVYRVNITLQDNVQNSVVLQYLFTMSLFDGDFVSFNPINNQIIGETLQNFEVEVEYSGNGINWNQSYIIVHNNTLNQTYGDPRFVDPDWGVANGGQCSTLADGSNYILQLELTNALNNQGANDGEYIMKAVLTGYDNSTIVNEINFVYDRVAPTVSNLMIHTNTRNDNHGRQVRNNQRKERNVIVSSPITSVSVDFTDETSGLEVGTHATNILILDENENVLPGNVVVSGNNYAWELASQLDVDGDYKIIMQGRDIAGNEATYEVAFKYISNANMYPRLFQWKPESIPGYVNTTINQPVFEFEYYDNFGLVENNAYSTMILKFPDGQFSSSGGDIEYSSTDSSFIMTYTLDGNLDENGANDGDFVLYGIARNNMGYESIDSLQFVYDSTAPIIVNSSITDLDGSEMNVMDNAELNNGITKVSAAYDDVTAGIYNVPNLTNVSLVNSNFEPIDGDLLSRKTRLGYALEWILDEPLLNDGSNDGLYYIELNATDRAGNSVFYRRPIILFSPLDPTDFMVQLDALHRAHLRWTPYEPNIEIPTAKKKNNARDLMYFEIYRVYSNGAPERIAMVQDASYTDNLQDHADGTYVYGLRAVYSAGESNIISTNEITLDRFQNVTISINDGFSPIDAVAVYLKGSDGIYNQIFQGTSNSNGQFSITDCYRTEYALRLEKEGFETYVDTIRIDNQNSLEFVLVAVQNQNTFMPTKTVLNQNNPNPFNPITYVNFDLKDESLVNLEIFNVRGQKIVTLLDKKMLPGTYSMKWTGQMENGKQAPTGVYFSRLRYKSKSEKKTLTKKMLMMK